MRYLVINPFGIGDVLFTTPLLRSIKERDPGSFIGYWCNQRVSDIFKYIPQVDKFYGLSRGDIKRLFKSSKIEALRSTADLFFSIRKDKFDICLDLSLDHRYALAAALAGIPRRVGFDYKKRGVFLTDKITTAGYQSEHVVEYYNELLKPLGITPVEVGLNLQVARTSAQKAANTLSRLGKTAGRRLIGISPAGGASWGKDARLKHWPGIKFCRFIEEIGKSVQADFVLLADASEKPVTEVIAMSAKQKVIDLAGKITLEELVAIISMCDLLVTNDGGSLHIAVAAGTKTVSLFGPTDHRVYGPYALDNSRHVVIKSNAPCSPCYHNFRYPFCRNNVCLDDIAVDEVVNAALKLLEAK